MFLTAEEVAKLTGKLRCDAQARQLDAMGINYRRRTDGSLVVLQAHITAELGLAGGRAVTMQRREPQVQP
jgi:hypothetical protein